MSAREPVRWGILGTANIARAQLLPALAESGDVPVAVGGRDQARTQAWAAEHGVARAVDGYQAVLEDPEVEAVYVPLPNPLHAEWAAAALEAGKAVLCEKPLTTNAVATQALIDLAQTNDALLWESFVFPFQAQHRRVVELIGSGAIGELREVVASFHFPVTRPENIRLSAPMFGGALADVGCYPMRLAHELFGSPASSAVVTAVMGDEVEVEAAGVLTYADDRRLLLTCGFRRQPETTALLLGSEGVIRVDNPWHPTPGAQIEVRSSASSEPVVESPTVDAHSFTAALRHIAAVLREDAAPVHLASSSALPVAQALGLAREAAGLPLDSSAAGTSTVGGAR
ncbi:Predicted dehydrogenase [Microlunatus sagamiharensis]|uniref:Predicted dehydrogenase n=1 Tax=Microlunatus sagamiharensis TaxID=546874 RepID=A0A1H2ML72_9ACTN|nr:Gfo/Idh/MocA family oxidoreductase [Microlunatus sagamiharensis]SDU93997.1 Predicted dehydrogenase [Microlunatus sagamiharensis]